MNCASCVAHVSNAATRVAGVRSADVILTLGRATIEYDPAQTDPAKVAAAITASGYPAAPQEAVYDHHHSHGASGKPSVHEENAAAWFRRALVGVILWLPLELTHWIMVVAGGHAHMAMPSMGEPPVILWLSVACSTAAMIYLGWGFYRSAYQALLHLTSNMDTLIALGASVAYGYSLIALVGKLLGWWPAPTAYYFMEASGLLALISLGHWLEARARNAAGSAISQLMTLAPATALRLDDHDQPTEVPLADVRLGDRLLVRPGDRVPTDAVVISGRGAVDESMVSGEPIPPTRGPGDSLIGGTLNVDGSLVVRAAKVGAETALAQMVQLVESAQSAKPPVQRLADQVAAVFVPCVLCIAILTGLGWYFYAHEEAWPMGRTWAQMANAVCSVLIIACPCALGLALPAALMVGAGLGARRGILIRDLDALQNAASIGAVVLDKTGTLTEGRPTVQSVTALDGTPENDILALAAAAEQSSNHPLAHAIVAEARSRQLNSPVMSDFHSEAGYGVTATIAGRSLLVGSDALLQLHGWKGQSDGESVVYVAEKSGDSPRVLGEVRFTDAVKADSARAISALHRMGLKTILLTGDAQGAAERVAKAVGIGQVRARVKPAEKAAVIRELQKTTPVAMVGDGINDAPALASARLGIAIGSGSDIAKESGGIILVSGNLMGVPAAIRLSRATMATIRRNLVFAFMYNVLAIPLAAFGLLNPLVAAAAMALSDVTVVGSALLLRRCKLDE